MHPNIPSCTHFHGNYPNIRHYLHMHYKTFTELQTIIPSLSHHFRHTVPCLWIFIPHKAHFTLDIWYYSHTPCRPFIGSSRTFRHRLTHFPSVPNTLVHISEYFYCVKLCTGTYSSIHPLPSIQPLHSHLLKVSISLRSIIDHSTPSFPFSKSIGTYSSLIYSFLFLSPFIFLSLSSCFVFRIFVLLFLPFTFHFPIIFEYLYVHVLVVSQYFRNNKSYLTP